jgi:hypothetical protein
MYCRMMGPEGLQQATEVAILSANYISARLKDHYPTLYASENGHVAHECILDLRPLKESSGVTAEDVAKRLIDYGFHAPTLSFPVAGTLMVEPTESETLDELDRFIGAMIAIREEIRRVEKGEWPQDDNPLKHAPHTAQALVADEWKHPYSRQVAAATLSARATRQVLGTRGPAGQRLRRPQPVLQLRAGERLRRRRLRARTGLHPDPHRHRRGCDGRLCAGPLGLWLRADRHVHLGLDAGAHAGSGVGRFWRVDGPADLCGVGASRF